MVPRAHVQANAARPARKLARPPGYPHVPQFTQPTQGALYIHLKHA